MSGQLLGSGLAALPPVNVGSLANTMENYAHMHNYSGPPYSGTTYAGWPLLELYKAAIYPSPKPSDVIPVMAEFTKRYPQSFPGNRPFHTSVTDVPMQQHSLETMLAMRMRWGVQGNPWAPGFTDITIKRVGDLVHLWVITKSAQSTVLEDEYSLYPSDALVTKLNLLKQE